MDWMLMPLRRYADFQGRSRRKEYWMFTLGILIAYAIFGVLFFSLAGGMRDFESSGFSVGAMVLGLLFAILVLGILIPALAVQIRRFHDQDKSGWFVLLGFIPYVGGIIVLVFMCLEGTKGPNRFGADPKESETLGDVFS